MSTRNPAAARSSSDSPPQNPYSRCSRAQSRHAISTSHSEQTERALPSRTARASGRSPAGAKNSSVRSVQAAWSVQDRGPVKISVDRLSAAMVPRTFGVGVADDTREMGRGSRWGDTGSPTSYAFIEHPASGICPTGSIDGIDLSYRWVTVSRLCIPPGVTKGTSMELRHLETLIAIDDEGTFTAAADSLRTVQSNVSDQVRQLESELGVTLLARGRGGATATESGRVVLARARRIRRELDLLHEELAALQGLRVGNATFGVVGTASRWLVPQLVEQLASGAPGVRLLVHEGASERLRAELVTGELALAVVTAPAEDPRIVFEHLADEPMVGLAPESTDIGEGPFSVTDLARYRLVLPPGVNPLRAEIEAAAARRGVQLDVPVEVEGIRLIADLVAAGAGIADLPETAVPPVLDGLRTFAIADLPPRQLGLATLKNAPLSLADRAVRDAVLEIVGWTRRGT